MESLPQQQSQSVQEGQSLSLKPMASEQEDYSEWVLKQNAELLSQWLNESNNP